MAIAIRQLTKHFAGEVSGVDLRKPLTKDEAAEIEAGMDKYAVLVFHDQDITDDQQMAFALNFQPRQGRQAVRERSPHASVQSRQLPVAFRLVVPPDPGEILAAVRAGGEPEGRQHRIRRHARRL